MTTYAKKNCSYILFDLIIVNEAFRLPHVAVAFCRYAPYFNTDYSHGDTVRRSDEVFLIKEKFGLV